MQGGALHLPQLPRFYRKQDGLASLSPSLICVYMDYSVQGMSLLAEDFIYYHELAHIYYDNPPNQRLLSIESACDEVAAMVLKQRGTSDSLIRGAMAEALANDEDKSRRIEHVDSFLWRSAQRY